MPEGERMVDQLTDACIEGFPRSANTFAYHAFIRANPSAHVAHHLHNPIQVALAADLGVPCAVTIRRPLDAISSFLVFWNGRVTEDRAIRRYVDFYSRVGAVRDRVAICRFEEVVDDPSIVGRSLNGKFRTDFRADPLDDSAKESLMSAIESRHRQRGRDLLTYTVPTRRTKSLKRSLELTVRSAVESHPRLGDAEAIYRDLARDPSPVERDAACVG